MLLILIVLTLLGTFSQAEFGLYDAQQKYFDSYFLREEIFGVPVYLPGVYLVLGILFFNMLAGGLIRIRKKPQTIGVIIAHFSILFMIVAGWVSFHWKKEGNMVLLPGQTSNLVQAYNDWQLEIREEGGSQVEIIRDTQFSDCTDGRKRTFRKAGLPFQLQILHYARNSRIVEEGHSALPDSAVKIDHYGIMPLKTDPNNEGNRAGLVIEAIDANNQQSLLKTIVTGTQYGPGHPDRPPVVIDSGGKRYAVQLTRERWQVPFELNLEKFTVELYEGTTKPRVYQSDVVRKHSQGEEKHSIGMNNPLRHSGYTFFQASYGRVSENDPYYTVLAVVKNPSDHWPTYSCIAATIGLLIHFVIKLANFLIRVTKNPTPRSA